MKYSIITLAALAALTTWSSSAAAEKPGTLGIGLGAGTLSNGLSGKYYMSSYALQANVGTFGNSSDRFGGNGFAVSVDALLEPGSLFSNDILSIDWNIGLGAGLGLNDSITSIAVAGVAGLEFNFKPIPIDLVLEYRPTLLVIEDVHFEPVDFSGHIRFYFF